MSEPSALKLRIGEETKNTMRAKNAARLGILRLINSEIKRVEVDDRRDLSDEDVLAILEKMVKQRLDSERQFRDAARVDLADQEAFEIAVVREFMPAPLTEDELSAAIDAAIAEFGAGGVRDMGKVMNALRGPLTGRADMKAVAARVKQTLGGR